MTRQDHRLDRLYDVVEEAHAECERLRKQLAGIPEIAAKG